MPTSGSAEQEYMVKGCRLRNTFEMKSSMTLFESAAGDDDGCKIFGVVTKQQQRFF